MSEVDYDLYEWIDNNIYGINWGDEKERLISLIHEVFIRIPLSDRNILIDKRGICFVAPILSCSAELVSVDFLSIRDETTTICKCPECNEKHLKVENGRYDRLVAIWIVCLSEDILKRTKDEALYTIAHELAHIYLKHSKHIGTPNSEGLKDREIEADTQVIQWGFEKELRETSFNYIYADG